MHVALAWPCCSKIVDMDMYHLNHGSVLVDRWIDEIREAQIG